MKITSKIDQWSEFNSLQALVFNPRQVLDEISVLIPTLGRDILEQSLYWILMGNVWPACIVIVEQGSNPDVVGWLKRVQDTGIKVKHIHSDQRGRSEGLNRALEQVETPFVAITDDDCFVDENWLLKMAGKLEQHPDDVITGRVKAAGEDMVVVVTSTSPSVQNRPSLKFDSMSGGNMGTSLEVFKKVGLFQEDPVMATAEDAEWAYRALRKGVSLRYEPQIVVAHFGWRDEGKRVEQYRNYALSHGGFYGKYLRRGDLFILVRATAHFARALRRWVRGKMSGDVELASIGKAYCLNLLPGIVRGFQSKIKPGELI